MDGRPVTGPVETVRAADAGRRQVSAVLRRVATAAKADFGFLMAVASRESSLRPDARAATSTASGLFQFIEQTWLEAVKRHGEAVGLGREAAAISKTQDGYAASSPEMRKAILDKRFDPEIAAKIAVRTFRDTAATLSSALGREPSGGELYLAHFLGPTGAARMIKADAGVRADKVAPAAARANAALFYDKGAPVSVGRFRASIYASFDGPSAGDAAAPPVVSARPVGPVGPVPAPRAPALRIRQYAPPLASAGAPAPSLSPGVAHAGKPYRGHVLPMSVFREILELDAVRAFSAQAAEEGASSGDAPREPAASRARPAPEE